MRAVWWWLDRWRGSSAFTDMNLEEQGAYRNLCDEVWAREDGVIPETSLAKACGDPTAWDRVKDRVLTHMTKVDGGWTNETARDVMVQSKLRAEKQRRYRENKRNTQGNESGNSEGSIVSKSPSQSLVSPSTTLDRSLEDSKDGSLPDSDRDKLSKQLLSIASQIGGFTGLVTSQVVAQCSNDRGAKNYTPVWNPQLMRPGRLLATVAHAESWLKELKARNKPQPWKKAE